MTMTKKEKILGALVAVHLSLVVVGAASTDLDFLGPVADWIGDYGQLTGAGSGYGFFTGDISSGLRAEFDVDDAGAKKTVRLETGDSHEADLRIGNILGVLSRSVEDEKLRRSVAASWSGKVLSHYPRAKSVTVRMETLPIPPMDAFRAGERPQWESFYVARFQRGGKKP